MMNRPTFFSFLEVFLSSLASAQFSQQYRDSINRLSHADHRQMMQQLGISKLRPGPSGNPEAPNAAFSDEAKVLPYFLPNPLEFDDGSKVITPTDWEKRRVEITEHFDREIYGRLPEKIPGVSWEVVSEKDTMDGNFPVKIKRLKGIADNSSYPGISVEIDLTLGTPAKSDKPVPVILEFGFNWSRGFGPQNTDELTWKQQLLQKGWGYAVLTPWSIQADNGAGLRQGIIGLVNKGEPRKPDDWGALRAWAWGASRAIDYFETNNDV